MENVEILVNDFAKRCFRDTGDRDYIAARLAYRSLLVPQFLWSSLQAVEKYLKYILLINRIKAKDINHDIEKGLRRVESRAPFSMKLSEEVLDFVKYLNTFGRHRYFETMYHYRGNELFLLDKTVWEIRRYCQPINSVIERKGKKEIPLMEMTIKSIEKAKEEPPHKFYLFGGELEKVIKKKSHPSREALIWKNFYFGVRARNTVKARRRMGFANSPLSLHPELVSEVIKYVFLPNDVKKAFMQLAREKEKKQKPK